MLEDPTIIDAVIENKATDSISLVLIHAGDWYEESLNIELLKAKLNSYLEFLTNGQFKTLYPQYIHKTVRFQLECQETLPDSTAKFLSDLSISLEKEHQIELIVNVDHP
jgi:hypothetical protein